jgi:glycyl-tRNA synthetase beta chain
MNKRDLLFEIGTEELPASAASEAIVQLKDLTASRLEKAGLPHGAVDVMGTPRRLVISVTGLAESGKASILEIKGPSAKAAFDDDGKPTGAAIGFARSQGVDPAELISQTTDKGAYLFAKISKPAPSAEEVLPEVLRDIAAALQFEKSMRWSDKEVRFSRPVRWLLALYGKDAVPVEAFGVKSGNITYGPRRKGSERLEVKDPSDYFKVLEAAGVIVDHEKRRETIEAEIAKAAKSAGGNAVPDPGTLAEVVFLVETPAAVSGSFDERFLSLPRAVIVTAMESHQRYFPIESKKGSLMPAFIVVHNGDTADDEMIRSGHERVLRARLADALFFYEEDAKRSLNDRIQDLGQIVFQEKLGTVLQKAERVRALAAEVGSQLEYSEAEVAEAGQAAMLAKADLSTQIVKEFPDLQGIVGEEYARRDGFPDIVASAIREHYQPKSYGDSLPKTVTGTAVSLADKVDTIVGCFGIGLIPTGSEDPYALRRHGQGIVSIILDKQLKLEVEPLIAEAVYLYETQKVALRPAAEILSDVDLFIKSRLKFHFTTEGFRYDVAEAVLETEINDLNALEQTARSLNGMLGSRILEDVLVGFERCFNLSKGAPDIPVDATLFKEPAETALWEAIEQAEAAYEKYASTADVKAYMAALAALRPTIDVFFDDVLVMDKDEKIKHNRLALLKKCVRLFLAVADFSKIVREGD